MPLGKMEDFMDLVNLEEYKTYAGITNPNQDDVITSLIPKVSQLVKSYCRRTFLDWVDEQKTEVFNGGEFFNLSEFPVISVSTVEYSSDYGQTYTALTEYTDWVLDRSTEQIKPLSPLGLFTPVINGYRVTYTAGYETLPEDLKLAVMDLITYYLKNDAAVHSTKAPGTNSVQIEYISTTSLPSHIKRVLDLYMANYN